MKIMFPDYITTALVDRADPNFPIDNILDNHPKKVWKGTTSSGVVSLSIRSGSEGISIFNTNATSIAISITVQTATTWSGTSWAGDTLWGGDVSAPPITEIYDLDESKQTWAEYYRKDIAHTVDITLVTDEDNIIEAGVIRAGPIHEFYNPYYGISEGLHDYSIVKELNNGAIYTRKRDVVKTFDFQIDVLRDNDFYTFMHNIVTETGPDPIPWRLTDSTNWDWVVYGRFVNTPIGSHVNTSHSSINISIEEVL